MSQLHFWRKRIKAILATWQRVTMVDSIPNCYNVFIIYYARSKFCQEVESATCLFSLEWGDAASDSLLIGQFHRFEFIGASMEKDDSMHFKEEALLKELKSIFFLFGKVTIFYSELQNVTNLSMRVLTILQVMITWMVLEMRIFRTLCVIPDISKRSIKSRTASCQSASQSVKVAISCGATVLHRLAPYTGTNSEHLKNIR